MQERFVEIVTRDGTMGAYDFHPDGPGPFPTILFFMDSAGLREELCDMARRIATVGYYVLLPNLYYRSVATFDFDVDRMSDPAYADRLAQMWQLNRSLSNTMIEQDTEAMLAFIDGDPHAASEKVATIGYCISGRFVLRTAGAFPDRIAAAASVYGARLITDLPDSAHLVLGRIKGEMYFAWAHDDPYASDEMKDAIVAQIAETRINGSVETYRNAEHGFAFPQRRAYHKAAAERHWERLFALFRRNLPAPRP